MATTTKTTIQPIAHASSTAQAPTNAATIGSTIDQDVAAIKEWIAVKEALVARDASNAWNWLKAQWPHLVTWAGMAYAVFKHIV